MQQILENLRAFGRVRLIALGVTGFGVIAAVFFGLSSVLAPTYVPLYSQLTPVTASQMVTALEQGGIPVKLSPDGSTVSVPQESIARARMAVADQGLPKEGVPGWELFDEASGLGMNSFLQRVNRLRALEGELARSIQTIDGIEAARIHLVLPEREAFSRSRPDPSASVIVRSRVGITISRRQALAIRALVASAVPDLSPSRVTVLSASGETILAEEGPGSAESTLSSARATIEERLERDITAILSARVGAGNARVQVSVDLSAERERRVSRSFDPNQQVARSIETRSEDVNERDRQSGDVDVGNNIPDALRDGEGAGPESSNQRARSDEIINYEIGSVESETVREPGEIQRVSVAVLVNGIYQTAEDGTRAYAERPQDELDRLAALVRSAVGFDERRGDSVSIDSLQFIDYANDLGEPVERSLTAILKDNIMSILRSVFAVVVIGMIMILGRGPLLKILDRGESQEDEAEAKLPGEAAPAALTAEGVPGAAPQIAAGPGQVADMPPGIGAQQLAPPSPLSGQVMDPGEGDQDEMVRLAAVEGTIRRQKLSAIGQLVEQQPDDALRVINGWLASPA